jgi:hypothetical protein
MFEVRLPVDHAADYSGYSRGNPFFKMLLKEKRTNLFLASSASWREYVSNLSSVSFFVSRGSLNIWNQALATVTASDLG